MDLWSLSPSSISQQLLASEPDSGVPVPDIYSCPSLITVPTSDLPNLLIDSEEFFADFDELTQTSLDSTSDCRIDKTRCDDVRAESLGRNRLLVRNSMNSTDSAVERGLHSYDDGIVELNGGSEPGYSSSSVVNTSLEFDWLPVAQVPVHIQQDSSDLESINRWSQQQLLKLTPITSNILAPLHSQSELFMNIRADHQQQSNTQQQQQQLVELHPPPGKSSTSGDQIVVRVASLPPPSPPPPPATNRSYIIIHVISSPSSQLPLSVPDSLDTGIDCPVHITNPDDIPLMCPCAHDVANIHLEEISSSSVAQEITSHFTAAAPAAVAAAEADENDVIASISDDVLELIDETSSMTSARHFSVIGDWTALQRQQLDQLLSAADNNDNNEAVDDTTFDSTSTCKDETGKRRTTRKRLIDSDERSCGGGDGVEVDALSEKRERRREQNRRAARGSRQRKRQHSVNVTKEFQRQQSIQTRLKYEVSQLRQTETSLLKVLVDHLDTCPQCPAHKHTPSTNNNNDNNRVDNSS